MRDEKELLKDYHQEIGCSVECDEQEEFLVQKMMSVCVAVNVAVC